MNKNRVDSIKKKLCAPVQPGGVERPVARWKSSVEQNYSDMIAQEVAVALVYNDISYAVMMASPFELEAFALGFSFTEGIIDRAEDVYSIEIVPRENGMEVNLSISSQNFMQLKIRRRNLIGNTGCGICGTKSLEQVCQPIQRIDAQFDISHAAIDLASGELTKHQPLQQLTGAVHGAAWCDSDGNILRVCEDVGRHNALDKLIGALHLGKMNEKSGLVQSAFQQSGFLLISSRASFEIVQKAAKAGIAVIAAVSAPTSLAIDIADEAGITLIGFSRQHSHVAYTHIQRLRDEA